MSRKNTTTLRRIKPLIQMGISMSCLFITMTAYPEDSHRRLFLPEAQIAQLDAPSIKQPILLPDLEAEQSSWLHYYGSFQQDQQISVLINQQWMSKATKLYGIRINPEKLSSDGLLPVTRSGETIWLAPGQGIRVQDWR
jgi:hypothetical protein